MYFKNIYYVYFHHGNARSLIQKQYKLLETYKKKKQSNYIYIHITKLLGLIQIKYSNIIRDSKSEYFDRNLSIADERRNWKKLRFV